MTNDTENNIRQANIKSAAERALAEAAERRAAIDKARFPEKELGGPSGKEPVRYGDWERKGVAYDF